MLKDLDNTEPALVFPPPHLFVLQAQLSSDE